MQVFQSSVCDSLCPRRSIEKERGLAIRSSVLLCNDSLRFLHGLIYIRNITLECKLCSKEWENVA